MLEPESTSQLFAAENDQKWAFAVQIAE